MKINSESRIHHPLSEVYGVYRDRLPEIATYIPDIREIQVLSRTPGQDGPVIHNLWIADREPPKMLQGIVKREMLRWNDYANWNDAEHYVAWRIEIPAFRDQVTCSGRNSFYAAGPSSTRVVLSGDLEIRLSGVPGVPGFMARRLTPKVEEFIVRLVTPNLARVNQSLQRFMDDAQS